jgi:ABC-type sugar transport system substrate-binding protein
MKSVIMGAAAALAVACANPAAAQQERPPASPEAVAEIGRIAEPFFQTLQAGDPTRAYADLFRGTLVESKTVEIAQLPPRRPSSSRPTVRSRAGT